MFSPKKKTSAPKNPSTQLQQQSQPEPDLPLPKEVELVMQEIHYSWEFMTKDDFNPVTLALELLDNNSQSRDINSFYQLLDKLEQAMDFIVNDHYQAFNNSIETFGKVTDFISGSQKSVKGLKMDLGRCKELLTCKRPDLLEMWVKSVQYKEMLRMLTCMDELKKAPQKIEQWIQSKYFLTAVKELLSALKLANSSDFVDIGALSDIRQTLQTMKESLHEVIVEELHRYLYLNSAYCDQNLFMDTQKDETVLLSSPVQPLQKISINDKAKRRKDLRLDSGDWSTEDLDSNPELDPFQFIGIMLTSLDLLGKLSDLGNIIRQRLPLELFKITEKVISETEEHWRQLAQQQSQQTATSDYQKKESKLSQVRSSINMRILEDLIKRLYMKFIWVMEMHQFALHVLDRLVQKKGQQIALFSRYSLVDVWNAIQNELKAFLMKYLTDLNHFTSNVSREIGKEKTIERRTVFKFSDSNLRQQKKQFNTDIQRGQNDLSGTVAEHRLVIKPSIFNIIITFKHTFDFVEKIEFSFLGRMEQKSEIYGFLNDLLLKFFVPQIEDMIIQRFHESVNGSDSFRVETCEMAPNPFRCSTAVILLAKDLLLSVYKIPVHQESFLKILEMMLKKFYEKCWHKFQSIVVTDFKDQSEGFNVVSGIFVQNEEIQKLLRQNSLLGDSDHYDPLYNDILSKKEMVLELKLKQERSFHQSELIFDQKKLEFLANMRNTLVWFSQEMENLKKHGDFRQVSIELRPFSEVIAQSHTRIEMESLVVNRNNSDSLVFDFPEDYLKEAISVCLTQEYNEKYKLILDSLRSLAEKSLFVLKEEIRCHCLYYLDFAMREGNYSPEEKCLEPDPYIMALNQDLIQFEQTMSQILPTNEQKFLFDGIATLICQMILTSAKYIKRMNRNGYEKMSRNIFSLQHNLSMISKKYENRLERAKQYFDLFLLSGEQLVNKSMDANSNDFTFEEYKLIFDFIFQPVLDYHDHPQQKIYDELLNKLKKSFIK